MPQNNQPYGAEGQERREEFLRPVSLGAFISPASIRAIPIRKDLCKNVPNLERETGADGVPFCFDLQIAITKLADPRLMLVKDKRRFGIIEQ